MGLRAPSRHSNLHLASDYQKRKGATEVTLIRELQTAIESVAAAVGPTVVGVGSRLRGAGVVIGDGLVLTNAHNLRGGEVTITFADGRTERGRVAGADLDGDLAVVQVGTGEAAAVAWADGAAVGVGAVVFGAAAVAGGGTRVTVGTISAVSRAFRGPGGRRIAGSLEHTAPLAPGSSGGPLLDAEGRLVGLNTNRIGEGFYLALPADDALRTRVDALGRGESARRRRLGIAIVPSRVARRLRRSVGLPDREGVLVRGVDSDGPAAGADIREGDLIVSIGGRAVTDADDLIDALAAATLPVAVELVRGTDDVLVSVAEFASEAADD